MKLEFKQGFGLVHILDGKETSVGIKRSFPNTHLRKYFSILDDQGKELAFIEKLDDLSESNKSSIEQYFSKLDFKLKILKVFNVLDEFGLRNWEVQTSSGKRSFQSALDNWPQKMNEHEFVIEDLNGDKYWVDLSFNFDAYSRAQLSFFLD